MILFRSLLCSSLAATLLAASPIASIQDKEAAKIAEEQALLGKQLARLRRTMETLLDNLRTEGRPRAAELLEQGLALLDERLAERDAHTLEELMDRSRDELERGQVIQSIEN